MSIRLTRPSPLVRGLGFTVDLGVLGFRVFWVWSLGVFRFRV